MSLDVVFVWHDEDLHREQEEVFCILGIAREEIRKIMENCGKVRYLII